MTNEDYVKRVKLKDDRYWRVKCVECDAWHNVVVLCTARLRIRPGGLRREREHSDIEIVCSGCNQSIEYMLDESQKRHILKQARVV